MTNGALAMVDRAFLWPMVAQVGLVAIVWVSLYRARLTEMKVRRIRPDAVATSRMAATALENVAAADNFRNLFELPVLFFAACLALAVTGLGSPLLVGFAWAYVALRAVHSFIHITYNRVVHRFFAYTASTLCLYVMWILFAVNLARSA